MSEGPTISTHVLDAQTGRPLQGVLVQVTFFRREVNTEENWDEPVGGVTDEDGRIRRLTEGPLRTDGEYLLGFSIEGPFFREISIVFHVDDPTRSYHVPLLLAPYSLVVYRGS